MTPRLELDLSDLFVAPAPPRRRSRLDTSTIADDIFARRRAGARTAAGTDPPPDRIHARALELEPGLPAIGSVIEKYRLERLIGIGGFAVVYRVRHLILDTTVAIKLLRPSVVARRPQLPSLLCEEARFAARIQQANVVRVFDVTHADEVTYIVMEYIDGPDLAVMLRRRGTLPPRMVLKIVRHVARGLRAGLRQSLIHRDVKPSNILLSRTGVTKLVDFGLARSNEGLGMSSQATVGTIGYMSPEQIDRPASVDFRSDLYSLGVTAYHALVGALPFATSDAASCAASHRHDPVPPAYRRNPAVPRDVSDLVDWLLEKTPARRPTSYDELVEAVSGQLARTPRS